MNKVIGNSDIMSMILSYHKPLPIVKGFNLIWYIGAKCLNDDSLSCDCKKECNNKLYPGGIINKYGTKYCNDCYKTVFWGPHRCSSIWDSPWRPMAPAVTISIERFNIPSYKMDCINDKPNTGMLIANLFKKRLKIQMQMKEEKEAMNVVDKNQNYKTYRKPYSKKSKRFNSGKYRKPYLKKIRYGLKQPL